jgi:hypothetical protein
MDFNEHKKEVSLTEFQELGEKLFQARKEFDEAQAIADEKSKKVEELKYKVLSIMEEAGLENQSIAGYGKIFVQNRFTVSFPKDPEKKGKFFEYLQNKGIFEDMVSVNSQTLNSWYKAEMEAAVEAGNADFRISGLDEPKLVKTLAMRKA